MNIHLTSISKKCIAFTITNIFNILRYFIFII